MINSKGARTMREWRMGMYDGFLNKSKASFILGGQWGSCGKGAVAASIAYQLAKRGEGFDIVTTNAGAQAGHTSTHDDTTRVVFHLPTAPLIMQEEGIVGPMVYLNAGSIIDPDVLHQELHEQRRWFDHLGAQFFIHPNAAVITKECKDAEMAADSAQTKIASTRKGVGQALARKVLRSGMTARDHPYLLQFVRRIDLNFHLRQGHSVLVEVPQGHDLSLDGPFYPYCTSRNCSVMQAASDAGIHPHFHGKTALVLRTFPIRVGDITEQIDVPGQPDANVIKTLGTSGSCHLDQREVSWGALDQTPEITTVTKRVRRVFTFSKDQAEAAMAAARPDVIQLTFCDYVKPWGDISRIYDVLKRGARRLGLDPEIVFQYGPSTADVHDAIQSERHSLSER